MSSSAEAGLVAPGALAPGPGAPAESARPDDLRRKVIAGLGWKLLSQGVGQGSRIVVSLVMAHILAPHDFGLAAMALTFSGLALVFSDPALGAALVQRRTITEDDRSTVFWTTVATGALCTVVGIALAAPIAAFFSEPRVRWLVVVESFSFVIVALSATQAALMTRAMSFRGLELRDAGGTVAGAAVGIAIAFAGFGPWAIIGQSIAAVSVSTILIWGMSSWRPRFTFSLSSLRECGGFGIKLFGSRLMAVVNTYADNLLVGRFIGSAALGLYSLAYNVMLNPIARVITPIQGVLIPAFSRLQDDTDRLGQLWLRGSRLLAFAAFPVFAGMIAVAPDFVPVVLGHRWEATVPVVQFLCLAGAGQAVQTLQHSILQARGKAGTLLRFMVASCVMNVTAFAIGLRWGIVGVAASFVVSRSLILPFLTWRTSREVGLRSRDLGRSLLAPILASLSMFLVVAAWRVLLMNAGLGPAARLPILISVGAAVYACYCALSASDLVDELRNLRRGAVA